MTFEILELTSVLGDCRLGAKAFKKILEKKQTKYRELLKWLDDTMQKEEIGGIAARVSCLGGDPFQSFRY